MTINVESHRTGLILKNNNTIKNVVTDEVTEMIIAENEKMSFNIILGLDVCVLFFTPTNTQLRLILRLTKMRKHL